MVNEEKRKQEAEELWGLIMKANTQDLLFLAKLCDQRTALSSKVLLCTSAASQVDTGISLNLGTVFSVLLFWKRKTESHTTKLWSFHRKTLGPQCCWVVPAMQNTVAFHSCMSRERCLYTQNLHNWRICLKFTWWHALLFTVALCLLVQWSFAVFKKPNLCFSREIHASSCSPFFFYIC